MFGVSSTKPKPGLFAGFTVPVRIASTLPAVLVLGFGQGWFMTNRECRMIVGWPAPFFGPLNAITQPGIVAPAVLVACAVPFPTSAVPQSAIACFSVVFARFLLQTGAAPGLILPSLSKYSFTSFTKPPWALSPGWAKFVCKCTNSDTFLYVVFESPVFGVILALSVDVLSVIANAAPAAARTPIAATTSRTAYRLLIRIRLSSCRRGATSLRPA